MPLDPNLATPQPPPSEFDRYSDEFKRAIAFIRDEYYNDGPLTDRTLTIHTAAHLIAKFVIAHTTRLSKENH